MHIFGLIYFNAGDLRHALTWFDRALALQPGFPEALSARTIVLQRLSQPHDALESFEAILRLRPHDAEALFSVGSVLKPCVLNLIIPKPCPVLAWLLRRQERSTRL